MQSITGQASSVGGKKHSVSTDYVLKVLGLDVCSDTIVGNDMIRGVSGGQRKRVTTGISSLSLIVLVVMSKYWPAEIIYNFGVSFKAMKVTYA